MENLSSFFADFNQLSGANVLGGVAAGLSLLHALAPSFVDEAFALVPHHTVFTPVPQIPVPFFWNLMTAHFFEGNLIEAFLTIPWVIALARMLERLWSPKALVFHLVFSACLTGVGVFIYELVQVYRTHSHYAFFAPVRGCVGLVIALAVGLRHAYPFEALPLVPHSWGLQCQHLPFALTAFISTVGFFFPRFLPEWPFAPLAFFSGWLHIRYLMWFSYAQAHGDHSPEFTFESLFPKPLRPLASCCGAIVYRLGTSCCSGFVKLREADETSGHAIMYDPNQAADKSANGNFGNMNFQLPASSGTREPGEQRAYEARRAKALQLLDDNIAAMLAGFDSSKQNASPAKVVEPGGEIELQPP